MNNFFKIDVSNTTLSTNDIINSKKDNLFYIEQNKSKNRLELINYNETPYSIFNIQGKTIIESSTNEYINFNEYNLRRGLYILKNNHQSFKFIIE